MKTKEIPNLTNKKELMERLFKALSKASGYSEYELKKETQKHLTWWRKLGMYVLVKEFDWTQRASGLAFGRDHTIVSKIVKEFDEILDTEGQKHKVLPYLNLVIHDLTL